MSESAERDVDERLCDWLDGRMSARDLERFEAELRVNPGLRARADEYRRTVEVMQQALRAPMRPIDVADAVMARVAGTASGGGLPRAPVPLRGASHRARWLSAGLAAAVLALLALLVRWQPAPEATEVAAQPPADRQLQDAPAAEAPAAARRLEANRDDVAAADPMAIAGMPQSGLDGAATGGEVGFQRDLQERPADGEVLRQDDAERKAVRLLQQKAEASEIVTALTVLPQLRAFRAVVPPASAPATQTAVPTAGAAEPARDRDQATPEATRTALDSLQPTVEMARFFDRAIPDSGLDQALPSPTLQIVRLAAVPAAPQPTAATAIANGSATATGEAWLIEGPGPEVYGYLAQFAAASRAFGFAIENSEVPTAVVLALVPAAAPTSDAARSFVGGSVADKSVAHKRASAPDAVGEDSLAKDDATAREGEQRDALSGEATSKAAEPKDRADRRREPAGQPRGSSRPAPVGGSAPPAAPASPVSGAPAAADFPEAERIPTAPARDPLPVPVPVRAAEAPGQPEPAPSPPVPPPVRVVIVIDRSQPR